MDTIVGAEHERVSEATDVGFYFARPYHSWERGANENTNGLVRQYIPKGSDFTNITQEFLEEVEKKLNERSRKRHGFLSPDGLQQDDRVCDIWGVHIKLLHKYFFLFKKSYTFVVFIMIKQFERRQALVLLQQGIYFQ